MKRPILAIPEKKLFEMILGGYFEGYRHDGAIETLTALREQAEWVERDAAETDPGFKQIIPYIVVYRSGPQIFTYQRAVSSEHYDEKRLQGKISIGIGGHIKPEDESIDIPMNTIVAAAWRELREELECNPPISSLSLLGFIYDNTTSVNQVHFGVLMTANSKIAEVTAKDKEIAKGEFMSLPDLKEKVADASWDMETWSRIALSALEDTPLFAL